jgi:hypothetical protein
VCIVVCDGLNGWPESIETVWPLAVVQTCVIHYVEPLIMPMSVAAASGGADQGLRLSA